MDNAGTYVVQLIVSDGTSNSPPDTVVVTTQNQIPTANAGADRTVGTERGGTPRRDRLL